MPATYARGSHHGAALKRFPAAMLILVLHGCGSSRPVLPEPAPLPRAEARTKSPGSPAAVASESLDRLEAAVESLQTRPEQERVASVARALRELANAMQLAPEVDKSVAREVRDAADRL